MNAPMLDADAASNLLSHWHAGVRAFDASHFTWPGIAPSRAILRTDGTKQREEGGSKMTIGSDSERIQFLANHAAVEARFAGPIHSRLRTCLANLAFPGHGQPAGVVRQLKDDGYINISRQLNENGGRSAVTAKGIAWIGSVTADVSMEEIDWNIADFGFVPLDAARNGKDRRDPARTSGGDANRWLPFLAPDAQPLGSADPVSITADPATWPERPVEEGGTRKRLPAGTIHSLDDVDRAIGKAVVETGRYDELKGTICRIRQLTGQQVAKIKADLTRTNGSPSPAPAATPRTMSREDEELIEDLRAELGDVEPKITELRPEVEIAQDRRKQAVRRSNFLKRLIGQYDKMLEKAGHSLSDTATNACDAINIDRGRCTHELNAINADLRNDEYSKKRLDLNVLEARRDALNAAIADVENPVK